MHESLEHVRVAQVPGLGAAVVHDAVVALGRSDEPRVLNRVEEVAFLFRVFEMAVEEGAALLDHCFLAVTVALGEHGPAIGGGVLLPGSETSIPFARDGCSLRVYLVEIGENGANRSAHVVQVESVEADAPWRVELLVVSAKPFDERR